MFSKFFVLCLALLAVVAQAKHERHHTHSHKNGTLTHHPFPDHDHNHPVEAGLSSGVAPQPNVTGGYSTLTTGVPVPTTYLTTEVVTKLITYCPGPTSLTQNGKVYTVTGVYIH